MALADEPHRSTTLEQAVELIDWYRARWEIEIYFHVIKNGCKSKRCSCQRLTASSGHWPCSWSWPGAVTYLMRMGRTCPDLDASLFFDPDEIRGAHLLTKKKMPATPPTLNEVVRLIAQVAASSAAKAMANPESRRSGVGLIKFMPQPRHYAHCAMGLADLCITT